MKFAFSISLMTIILISCSGDPTEKSDVADTTIFDGKDTLSAQDSMPVAIPEKKDSMKIMVPKKTDPMPIKRPESSGN
jgi:hypothetical protein